ncbi:MAG: hypothetical protein ABIH88_00470 [Patescibacteria group bacterium]|nr:hypothetical protein [Patescibacteria group bacterium]
MLTLTETAKFVRRGIKIFFLLIFGFFALKIFFSLGTSIWKRISPPAPPPPTVAFGTLPEIVFPQKVSKDITFELETIEGKLPKLPSAAKVFLVNQRGANLLSPERATQKAQEMGFGEPYEKISETVFRWKTLSIPETILEMNINNGNFFLKYNFENDPEILIQKNLPNEIQAAQEAKAFLQSNNLLSADLATGSAQVKFFKFQAPSLVEMPSLSQADLVKINLFRADIDGFAILPPDPSNSLINFTFSGNRQRGKRIVEVHYSYSPIERSIFATYPLLPIEKAWEEFKKGNGLIINQTNLLKVVIRKVYLAYYDSIEPQKFLQPIYVFQGDQGFLGFYPAIDPSWQTQTPAN